MTFDFEAAPILETEWLRRLGFQLEGIWRDRVRRGGRFYSLWQFGILESEYRRRDGPA